tara:strand:- start:13263 stop:13931 length:669 start_codon:yes stop_codon:yes gene_type:complete
MPRHFIEESKSNDPKPNALKRLHTLAERSLADLTQQKQQLALGRIRGTGPGVHFGSLIDELDIAHPVTLKFPFENSDRVGGGIWGEENPPKGMPAIAKLQWLEHADDLPIHVHEHSDRFIVVIGGRGFFHWSDQSVDDFDGSSVHTIAARDRDVFVFRRGLLHTFSTAEHSMTLLSIQSPFIPFDASEQYALPKAAWAAQHNHIAPGAMNCSLSPVEPAFML